ncbi:MAG: DUF3014 domain-containing protein [Candidatus Aminicenantes bacterium]|nr:DUF3014 domain-containing protein [Candidatus Aminicenantes bacterium]
MEENKKVIVTGIIIILAIALAVMMYFFVRARLEERAAAAEKLKTVELAEIEESIQEKEEFPEPLQVELDKSDSLIRQLAAGLSSHPAFEKWLLTTDLIRKFVAAVDNIANGLSPRPQIDSFSPDGKFKIKRKKGSYYIDPESYSRYDIVADVFASLDTKAFVRLYRQLNPAIQEAYKDLGYPNEDFQNTLVRAIAELMKVPVIYDDIKVTKKVVTYTIVDSRLEELSEAQKHLLRMGPENVQRIQDKLKEIAKTLGI